jgi:hypothetical protein
MENMDKSTGTGGNNKTQSAIVIALVAGLLAGFFIGRSWGYEEEVAEKEKMETAENDSSVKDFADSQVKIEGSAKTEPVSSGNTTGDVTVADQNAGMSVAVKKVTLSDAGWVVVRENTGSGMGNILGALWLPAGTKDDASVELLRGTEAKKNYFVVLYTDNGDKKFNKVTDLPIAIDGKVVSGVFSAK